MHWFDVESVESGNISLPKNTAKNVNHLLLRHSTAFIENGHFMQQSHWSESRYSIKKKAEWRCRKWCRFLTVKAYNENYTGVHQLSRYIWLCMIDSVTTSLDNIDCIQKEDTSVSNLVYIIHYIINKSIKMIAFRL